jgi:ribose/xylose/arabinose/galactoside ABC-type transport system permease subunit
MILWINNSWLWVNDPVLSTSNNKLVLDPVPTVLMISLYVIAAIVMKHTILGRHIYAIGGTSVPRGSAVCHHPDESAGLHDPVCAPDGGVLMEPGWAVSPGVGLGLEFEAITAVILGGTKLSGGVGRVEKTIVGAIIVGMILNFMTIRGISAHFQRAVTGFIILGAALLDQLSRRRSGA